MVIVKVPPKYDLNAEEKDLNNDPCAVASVE